MYFIIPVYLSSSISCTHSGSFQVALAAFMPAPVFVATAGLTALAVAISLNKLKGSLRGEEPPSGVEASQPQQADLYRSGKIPFWSQWQLIVGSAGLLAFVQVKGGLEAVEHITCCMSLRRGIALI
jgi:hypothetical protein